MKIQTIKSNELETKQDDKLDISQCFNFCSYNGITYDIDRVFFKADNIIVLHVYVEGQETTITITETKETFDILLALYMKRK
jgi:hypothetical protein